MTNQYSDWVPEGARRPWRLLGVLRREADESRWDVTGPGCWRARAAMQDGYIIWCYVLCAVVLQE